MASSFENRSYQSQKAERRKNRSEQMADHIMDISREINQEMKDDYGVEDFLNPDGSINMESYAKRNAYSEEEQNDDKRKISDIEKESVGDINESMRENFRDKFGAKTDEELIEAFKKEKAGRKNKQMEMIAMSVLYKVLKDEFIVVHTAIYDDYVHKADNILVNKMTGEAIIALDALHDYPLSNRSDKKMARIIKIARQGGEEIKYGFTIESGKIVEMKMEHMPVFLLSLTNEELDKAIPAVSLNTKSGPNESEIMIMRTFIRNLYHQFALVENSHPSKSIRGNLEKFKRSLKRMEEITAAYGLKDNHELNQLQDIIKK